MAMNCCKLTQVFKIICFVYYWSGSCRVCRTSSGATAITCTQQSGEDAKFFDRPQTITAKVLVWRIFTYHKYGFAEHPKPVQHFCPQQRAGSNAEFNNELCYWMSSSDCLQQLKTAACAFCKPFIFLELLGLTPDFQCSRSKQPSL